MAYALLLTRVPTFQPQGSRQASVPRRLGTSEEAKLHPHGVQGRTSRGEWGENGRAPHLTRGCIHPFTIPSNTNIGTLTHAKIVMWL